MGNAHPTIFSNELRHPPRDHVCFPLVEQRPGGGAGAEVGHVLILGQPVDRLLQDTRIAPEDGTVTRQQKLSVVTLDAPQRVGHVADEPLLGRLSRAMEASGERWWRLPMDAEYRDMMKSPIADILNSNPNRKAHPIQGAAFLAYFVQQDVPWAHIDIAGVHAVEGDQGPYVKGPTGWGTRLLAELLAGR